MLCSSVQDPKIKKCIFPKYQSSSTPLLEAKKIYCTNWNQKAQAAPYKQNEASEINWNYFKPKNVKLNCVAGTAVWKSEGMYAMN